MKIRPLWVIVDAESGKRIGRFGAHGSRESAQAMLDLQLSSFDVNIKAKFEIRKTEKVEKIKKDQ